jgi:hypothetical protein
MKPQNKKVRDGRSSTAVDQGPAELLRSWLLAALMALCVARPLLPSEGASWLGDGQPFNMLWLIIAAGCLLLAIARGSLARQLNLIDAAVAALTVICVASALVGSENRADERELRLIGTGSPRMAINMLWEWVAAGASYFLIRQLVRTPRETRALIGVMLALTVVSAAYGYYQVFVGLPAARADYAANPDAVLNELNQWYPPDSPERLRFEKRLESTEPLATFALANSLAGFLAPWMLIAVGIGWSALGSRRAIADAARPGERHRSVEIVRRVALAFCLLAVAGCFVLTKSRTGYVALAAGLTLAPFCLHAGRNWLNWKVAVAGGAALLVLVGGAVAIKGLDAELVTEASKSLGFRWQYWRATLAMIGKHLALGVGPGNFQDYYTQFKLPEASEEVRDPHNFLLEVWATSGTFALVALCGLLGLLAWRTWRMPCAPATAASVPTGESSAAESTRNDWFMAGGAAAGFVFAFLVGPPFGLAFTELQLAGGLAVGAVTLALIWPWIVRGTLPPRLPGLGLLVLAIHLLASGGITFPGVSGTFWMLAALAANQIDGPAGPETSAAVFAIDTRSAGNNLRRIATKRLVARLLAILAFAATCSAAVACYILAYRPVMQCHAALARAEEPGLDAPTRLKVYLQAANADPLSPEPWMAIAELEIARLKQNPDDARAMRTFIAATGRISDLRPHSSAAWAQVGQWYNELYERNHQIEAARTATDCLAHAVELYPNSATLRGRYALALATTGQRAASRRNAEKAWELDGITPHADKKIPTELAAQLKDLLAEAP